MVKGYALPATQFCELLSGFTQRTYFQPSFILGDAMDFLSFFVGLWVGGIIGVIVMALMRAGSDPKTRGAAPVARNATGSDPAAPSPTLPFVPAKNRK